MRTNGCTERIRIGSQKEVVTTNQIYRCEEFEEDDVSIYDAIEETDHYDDLNEKAVYLDVLGDVTTEHDKGSKPELPHPRQNIYLDVLSDPSSKPPTPQGSRPATPQGCKPPSPQPNSEDQNQNNDYEGLKREESDHTYIHVNNDETEGGDQDAEAQD